MRLDQALQHARETGCFIRRELWNGHSRVELAKDGETLFCIPGFEPGRRFRYHADAPDILATDWTCSDGWSPSPDAALEEARECLRLVLEHWRPNDYGNEDENELNEKFLARCRAAIGGGER